MTPLAPFPPIVGIYACSHCKRVFRLEQSLRQHCRALHPGRSSEAAPRTCDTCKESFPGPHGLEDHQRAVEHCYCLECQILFDLESKARKHLETFHASQFRCCDCEQDFTSGQALDQHLSDKLHRRITCQICDQDFGSKFALDRHIVVEHHALVRPKRVFMPPNVHGCYICQRRFAKNKDLDQHLVSRKHRPLSDLKCAASDKCKRRFGSPSALLRHLESGTCRSGIDRHTINKLVRDNDIERVISSGPTGQDLLRHNYSGSEWSSSTGTPILTPTSSVASSPVMPIVADYMSEQRVSSFSLEASAPSVGGIPTSTSFQMSSLADSLLLPQHNKSLGFSASSAHSQIHNHDHKTPLFHCPGALASSTPHAASPRKFTTLSGLAQHIESGACGEGPATLKKAIMYVQERFEKMGFGSIRLLK